MREKYQETYKLFSMNCSKRCWAGILRLLFAVGLLAGLGAVSSQGQAAPPQVQGRQDQAQADQKQQDQKQQDQKQADQSVPPKRDQPHPSQPNEKDEIKITPRQAEE